MIGLRLIILSAIALALAGCARPVGDLGRVRTHAISDTLAIATNKVGDRIIGAAVSDLNETDEEIEMRDRIWRFLEAPHARDWSYHFDMNMQRVARIKGRPVAFDTNRYYAHLRTTQYRSSRTRYQTMIRDIGTDLDTLPATFNAICKVKEVDHRRALAIGALSETDQNTRAQVDARRRENAANIDWFTTIIGFRYDAYSQALKQILIETPHEAARNVDAKISQLGIWITRAERGDFCGSKQNATVKLSARSIVLEPGFNP